jgi:hypothetical protein
MHRILRMASSTEASELPIAPPIQGALGHHAARGISSAKEQDIVFAIGHGVFVNRRLYGYSVFDGEQQALVEDSDGAQQESASDGFVTRRRGEMSFPYTVLSPNV